MDTELKKKLQELRDHCQHCSDIGVAPNLETRLLIGEVEALALLQSQQDPVDTDKVKPFTDDLRRFAMEITLDHDLRNKIIGAVTGMAVKHGLGRTAAPQPTPEVARLLEAGDAMSAAFDSFFWLWKCPEAGSIELAQEAQEVGSLQLAWTVASGRKVWTSQDAFDRADKAIERYRAAKLSSAPPVGAEPAEPSRNPLQFTKQEVEAREKELRNDLDFVLAWVRREVAHLRLLGKPQPEAERMHSLITRKHGLNTDNHG